MQATALRTTARAEFGSTRVAQRSTQPSGATADLGFDTAARLGRDGLLTLTTPRAIGGEGAGYLAAIQAIVERAAANPPAARLVASANLGASGVIRRFAPKALQRRAAFLARAGAPPCCIVAETPGRFAERRGAGWRIWGEAGLPQSSAAAALLLIRAPLRGRGADAQARRGGVAPEGHFIVDCDQDDGVVRLHRAQDDALLFDSVEIPEDRALAAAEGWRRATAAIAPLLTAERRLGVAALALGAAQNADAAERIAEARLSVERAARAADANGWPDPAHCARAHDLACALANTAPA